MQPCIYYYLFIYLLFHLSLKAQHVSSGTPLIIRSSNCICSLWFTYVCKPEAANTVRAPDDERCAARNMFTYVCKPEAANTVRAPDDERCAARNMFTYVC